MDRQTAIIGVGNDFRGDDAIGLCVARALQTQNLPVQILLSRGDASELIEWFGCYKKVVLVDAMCSGSSEIGTVKVFDLTEQRLPETAMRASTHIISVSEAVEMARVLGRMPEQLFVVGVEAGNFTPGTGLSDGLVREVEAVGCFVRGLVVDNNTRVVE